MTDYKKLIIVKLLRKYDRRKAKFKDAEVKQRIQIKPTEAMKTYFDYNVNELHRQAFDTAVQTLISSGFVSADMNEVNGDYLKIYLNDSKISELEQYAAKNLCMTIRSSTVTAIDRIIKNTDGSGLVEFYKNGLQTIAHDTVIKLDEKKEKDILHILKFLETNNTDMYIREASMLVFGDSKCFEKHYRSQIRTILSNYFHENGEDIDDEENLLERYHIFDTDQDICIKGHVMLSIDNRTIDVSGLSGGVSFSIKDIDKISHIKVRDATVMTVENKTSFLRIHDTDTCCIYLGGFAAKAQISFIRKIIADNPNCRYQHFGDIDAGGFWIHKKLCEQTDTEFELYHMDESDLGNPTYGSCLKKLTESDISRLKRLRSDSTYSKCIEYMLKHNCKLEQEIISFLLFS